MRVCFLQYQGSMYSGGQGVYLYYVTRELARLGHDVHVIAGPPYPGVAPEVVLHRLKPFSFWSFLDAYDEYVYRTHPVLFFHPVNLYEFAASRFNLATLLNMFSMRAYHKLNELERQAPFDVVHDNQTLAYGVWLMKARGRPVVATVHHPLTIDRQNAVAQANGLPSRISRLLWYPWVMQRWVAQRLDRIITVSESSAASVADAFGLSREQVRVVHDGVDLEAFRPLDDVSTEAHRLLFVGNSEDRNKGIAHLLEALQSLRHRVPFRLTVVHHPGSRLAAELAGELGLAEHVTFREGLSADELAHEYNRAQFVVSPSLYEGFGLPAAEALACGTPVVATTAGALPEIVQDGHSGLLVPPGDVPALANALEALLRDPGRCRALGEFGARRTRERFTWRRTAENIAAVYSELCGAQPVAHQMAELVR